MGVGPVPRAVLQEQTSSGGWGKGRVLKAFSYEGRSHTRCAAQIHTEATGRRILA